MFSLDGYKAVTASGGVVHRTDRGVLAVSGADRVTWLQGLLTNDVTLLKEGESQYSAYLTPTGRMITDMHVLAEADRILLDVPATLAASLRDRLEGLIFAEDVTLTDESARLMVWTVLSGDGFREVIGETLPPEFQMPAIDLDTFEVIRIERGVPRFPVDMDETTIPLEAGIEDRAISFTKGCYVGQEVIVRVTHRGGGRVAKRLVQWLGDPAEPIVPPAQSRICAPNVPNPSLPGKGIGHVTSAAFSPSLHRVVGLGYVHRDFTDSGTDVTVVWKDAQVKAVIQ